MSDSASTVATKLTDSLDINMCMSLGIRMFCWLLLLCFLFYFISLTSSGMMGRPYSRSQWSQRSQWPQYDVIYSPPDFMEQEDFSNDEMYSYNPLVSSRFQRVPLTAPIDEKGESTNLYFGQADRYIVPRNEKIVYKLQVFANLAVLDGNIYANGKDAKDIKQEYLVVLKNNGSMISQPMKKDGDGIYKLSYETSDIQEITKLEEMKEIVIYYNYDGESEIILKGKF